MSKFEEFFPGYRFECPNRVVFDMLVDEIFIQRCYDCRLLNEEPYILDCGSNVGLSVLNFKHQYPRAKVVAFEADPRIFAFLEKNIFNNPIQNVEIHNAAVCDRDGVVPFYGDAEQKSVVGMSLTKRLEEKKLKLYEMQVPAVRLSSYAARRVDMLKLDVEGSELEVLIELERTGTLGNIGQMFVEYHCDKTNPDNKLSSVLQLLERNGFSTVIHSTYGPPYLQHAFKPFSLMLFAAAEGLKEALSN